VRGIADDGRFAIMIEDTVELSVQHWWVKFFIFVIE
jgi:hypothetical protein